MKKLLKGCSIYFVRLYRKRLNEITPNHCINLVRCYPIFLVVFVPGENQNKLSCDHNSSSYFNSIFYIRTFACLRIPCVCYQYYINNVCLNTFLKIFSHVRLSF